ncbi:MULTISPECIES: SDR family oxidoreductase [Sphingobium]|uniref:SDR family oxidoreductase n=1 Tax=Sphingobium TaxID=165695 RepID=UPI0015EBE8DB|nr:MULTISPECIES: SDR family oxidoreductase [Sphingobium]MCW2361358.1 NAD(P)-dependent dehydrogenase (short-subunit alcohol dehydrogenase family) [Sphingobium sp. B10D3B]MCW2401963.1 NAD(P)-dependent dehydrogenase (short-subunit alcohol dehydrogenase family) [Sphingobium sp. B10D7B]MCW2408942.1 NAD(P)-dependent dehydrogenase (short-subunit alcohol dehydrogenase family) [Sphingobium xanthum]
MTAQAPLALVTGGHRRLGARIAMHLARAGYALAIHGRHDAEPHRFLSECLAATGVRWHGFVADFLTPGAAEGLMPAVTDHFGRAPDLLVNSASLFGESELANVSAGQLADYHQVNTVAPVLLTQAFAAAARPDGAGASIVNILDQRLAQPHGDQLAYTLGKAGLEAFTRIAARTLAPAIRVNAVSPGLTLATYDYTPEQLERLASHAPLGVLPTPEAVGEAVLYLARAESVTGQTIIVDGGAHMRTYARDFLHLET